MVAAEEAAAAEVDAELLDIALSTGKLGVTYADIRINRYRSESINTRERQVQNVSRGQNFGFGVRVLFKGTWARVEPQRHAGRRSTHHATGRRDRARQLGVSTQAHLLVPVEKVVTS